jgi:hypothetical protein
MKIKEESVRAPEGPLRCMSVYGIGRITRIDWLTCRTSIIAGLRYRVRVDVSCTLVVLRRKEQNVLPRGFTIR